VSSPWQVLTTRDVIEGPARPMAATPNACPAGAQFPPRPRYGSGYHARDQRGIRRSGVGLLFRAAGERILIRVLLPGLFPQDRACHLRERPTLETTGDRCEPLDSAGMWTKCGPATPRAGAATLRIADLAKARQTPAGCPDKRAPPATALLGGALAGSGPGTSPCIDGLSLVTGMAVPQRPSSSNQPLALAS
jgi:hypothetical protein